MAASDFDDHMSGLKVDPRMLNDYWYLELTFRQCWDSTSTQLRGHATIDLRGGVRHDVDCFAWDGTLDYQIRCTCAYDDERVPYETADGDPLIQLELAIKQVGRKEAKFAFERKSQVLDKLDQQDPNDFKTLLVEALRIREGEEPKQFD